MSKRVSDTRQKELDSNIVQAIVKKLGYTEKDVKYYVRNEPRGYVATIYNKMIEDQKETPVS